MTRAVLALALVACSAKQERAECSVEELARITTECVARVRAECGTPEEREAKGMRDDDCPAIVECDQLVNKWEACK